MDKILMTPEEFYEEIKSLCEKSQVSCTGDKKVDWEKPDLTETHIQADRIMADLLISMGYKKGAELFLKADKWYD